MNCFSSQEISWNGWIKCDILIIWTEKRWTMWLLFNCADTDRQYAFLRCLLPSWKYQHIQLWTYLPFLCSSAWTCAFACISFVNTDVHLMWNVNKLRLIRKFVQFISKLNIFWDKLWISAGYVKKLSVRVFCECAFELLDLIMVPNSHWFKWLDCLPFSLSFIMAFISKMRMKIPSFVHFTTMKRNESMYISQNSITWH